MLAFVTLRKYFRSTYFSCRESSVVIRARVSLAATAVYTLAACPYSATVLLAS